MKIKTRVRRGKKSSARRGWLVGSPVVQPLESRVLLASTPYFGTPVALPATVMAGNFDNGGQNVAYLDSTPGNQGGAYRSTDVDIEPATDAVPPGLTPSSPGVGFDVGHITAGEWLNFSVNVPAAGAYTFAARVASGGSSGTYHFNVDGTNATGSMNLPNTGGWQTYTTITSPAVNLTGGNHVLQLSFDTSVAHEMGNFEWFQVASVGPPPPSVSIAATASNAQEYPAVTAGAFTVSRTGSTAQPLTVNLGIAGSATNGTDYSTVSSTLVIPAGAASANIAVNPIDDTKSDGNETVIASLSTGNGYAVNSSAGTATVTIADSRVAAGSTPYYGTPFAVPTTIQAEDFDNGGQNVAYFDTTPGNQGGSYRSTDVDIEPTTDAGGGFNIGHITNTEWLQYTVNIPGTGNYDISVRVASATTGGAFRLRLDGADLTGAIAMPNTGGWQTWQTITKAGVSLPGGTHLLRLTFEGPTGPEFGNVNWISIARSSTSAPATFAWAPIANQPIMRGEAEDAVVNGKLYAFGGFYNSLFQATTRSDVYDPASNTWTRIADMPEALTHSATIVDGNTVWFMGGFVGNHPGPQTSHVWKYDTVAQTWTPGPALPFAVGAGAAAVYNRQIHFFGGLLRDASGNPTTNTNEHWVLNLDGGTAWTTAANLPRARNHLAGAMLNGKIYAIGGQNLEDETAGNSAAVDVYDPTTNAWVTGPDLPVARGHINPSTFVVNGRIIVIGGTMNGDTPMADVTEYDPVSNSWIAMKSLPSATKSPVAGYIGNTLYVSGGDDSAPVSVGWSAAVNGTWETQAPLPVSMGETAGGIINGNMYIVGEGTSATVAYSLAANTWSSTTALAARPFVGTHHGAEVFNGKLYLFGGIGGGSEGKVQIYDPVANTWTLGAAMPYAGGSVATALIGGKIYCAGGIVGSSTTNQSAIYDPVKNTWTVMASMPLGVNHAAASTDGSKLYVFGGRDGGNIPSNGFNATQIYDPTTNTWTSSTQTGSTLAPLPQARGGMGKAVYLNGEFYVMGGETVSGAGATANEVYNRVDIYNPVTNTWRLGTPMITARHGIFPLAIAGRIYVAGGGVHSGDSTSTMLEVYNAG